MAEKLYVGCGLTSAPEEFKESVDTLKERLRENFHVFDFLGLVDGTAEDVYRWDIEHCVADCDMFIGVCDYPSIGLGWELSEAVRRDIPTLGVAHHDSLVTRMVLGAAGIKPNFEFRRYGDLLTDVPQIVEEKAMVLRGLSAAPTTL